MVECVNQMDWWTDGWVDGQNNGWIDWWMEEWKWRIRKVNKGMDEQAIIQTDVKNIQDHVKVIGF